ncbi:hypothetical protein DHODJN_26235 [Methylorubrum extorquens]
MRRGQKTSAEQVVLKLRQIEVQTAQGKSLALACKEAEISEQKLRDECLRQEIFYSLKEAQVVIGLLQNTYNRVRQHSSLGYRPPAPVSFPDLAFRLPMAITMHSPLNQPGPKYLSGQPISGSATAGSSCCEPTRARRRRWSSTPTSTPSASSVAPASVASTTTCARPSRRSSWVASGTFNRPFLQLCSHHLVEPTACNPGAGWKKVQVENQVRTARNRFFKPVLLRDDA